MPNLFTVPAGVPIARVTAAHLLAALSLEQLSQAVIFLPTRRSANVMRTAFQQELQGKAALLPRMLPLAETGQEILSLLGGKAFEILDAIPPAMPVAQQRYILTQQVFAYERKRMGAATIGYALKLADALMELQDNFARSGITLTQKKLRQLMDANGAEHWQDALLFLGILTDAWPRIEQAFGMTIGACREVKLLEALASVWTQRPPDFPVIAVGSTASQPATAALLKTIARLPQGRVILPGLDVTLSAHYWEAVRPGHPLFHLKELLKALEVTPAGIASLHPPQAGLWLDALAPAEMIPAWGTHPVPDHRAIRLVPCRQPEEEARVISLLLREGLENPKARLALITPDEGLIARVAIHMKRYEVTLDRLNAGTLAHTQVGSLWAALMAAIAEAQRPLLLRELLHHPLLAIDAELLAGIEKGWHGINRRRAGQLPRHDPLLKNHPGFAALAAFVAQIAGLSRVRLTPGNWLAECAALLRPLVKPGGQGEEAVMESFDALDHAEAFGAMTIEDFRALIDERLNSPWRDAGFATHPRVHLLTPVEARLQQFDRVILANMQEAQWPGLVRINPWLNLAAEKALGLPPPEERISLMAHDVLMLASHGEVFLTYPERDAGSPTRRSRFIERLVTLLESHGISESTIVARHYTEWADALYASDTYAPELPAYPLPSIQQRPSRLAVTDIDKLFTDPFSIYAKQVLALRALDDIDATPQANDFGSLAHRAIEMLTRHWNEHALPADEATLQSIAGQSLRDLSERPNIALFWRARLLGGLRYVNALEIERRAHVTKVLSEQQCETSFDLGSGKSITLYGRIDRLEIAAQGTTIVDYKTGDIPSEKSILEGRALQLLVYAMMLQSAQSGIRIEYWQLPKLGDAGARLGVSPAENLSVIEEKLKVALTLMLDPATPFLARPVLTNADERYGNEYDGISRYDEWAG